MHLPLGTPSVDEDSISISFDFFSPTASSAVYKNKKWYEF